MHYIPESTSEMLRGGSACNIAARPNFHYLTAPLYLLTVFVAVLLVADSVLLLARSTGQSTISASAGATLWGYRLALLAAVFGGARILYHTLDGLLSGRIGSDLALTVACLAAIALGEHQTAGLVVLISLIGECIEGYTIDRARSAVRDTFALWPAIAHRNHDGREQDIPVEEVRVGDIVTIRPGERVPVDGQVVAGSSVVDQSPFTGESVPVDKTAGDKVLAGTLNQFGALTVVAESIGDNTALARVAQLVGTAASRKAILEQTAERLAKWFLPAVLTAAVATLIGWRIATGSWHGGYLPALGVLVVACPCPLVLATPCAVMASLAWLARRGVVVKGSAVLERLATVDSFAFDKTGTLTQGALALGEIIPVTGLPLNDVLRLAAIAERSSEHLLARILVNAAEERGLTIPLPLEFRAVAGAGVMAKVRADELSNGIPVRARFNDIERVEGSSREFSDATADRPFDSRSSLASIVVGNRRALDQCDIAFSQDVAMLLKEREAAGESPLVVAVDGTVIGIIGVRETVRPESRRVLEELREVGIVRFALLTGDRPQPADAVVKSLGLFEHVATEQLPADKANWVEASRKAGWNVAMVGDGVNDAAALAAADVGLALGRAGGDLAAAAGDIILLGDPLRPLPGLVRLARALVQNIWQSILVFAFGLNALGVLACSMRWLDPIGGAIFHELASLAVMANAMRLLWFEGLSSPLTTRWMGRAVSAADWVAANASPSKWVFRCIERWRLATRLVGAVALVAWLLSGMILISADEQAVVTRFGRFETTLSAGLHWRWPWPLDRLTRSRNGLVRSVAIGYRQGPESRDQRGTTARTRKSLSSAANLSMIEWTSIHDDRDRSNMGEESMMLTADEVPVELMAEVQYRIRNLREFVFTGSRRPDDVLRATAESVLREVAASASLDSLLTERRAGLERLSLSMLEERIERYELGVELVDLQWLDVHPPQPVVPAYRLVADALEERELLINEAEAYASRTLLATVGEDAFSLLQLAAKTQAPDVMNSPTRTDWLLSDDLWRQLREQNSAGRMRLSGSAAAIIFDGQTASVQREMSAWGASQRFEKLFAEYTREPRLTNHHLYWSIMAEVLMERPLMIVDPKAVGRQQLWLGEPMPGILMPVPKEPGERE